MPTDDKGKVIVSLLAGATAGIVAGLLLAPETGEGTRKSLAEGANKWWGSIGPALQGVIAKFTGSAAPAAEASGHADQQAADTLLHNMNHAEPGDLATPPGAGNGRSVAGTEDQDADEDLA